MTFIPRKLAHLVQKRAAGRCEYCKMSQSLQGATFHLEHVMPKHRGGETVEDNLAWCCPSCNLHKADRIEAPDPQCGDVTPLFNPRNMNWREHFQWEGHRVKALTPTGRATVEALHLNHERRLRIRRAEETFGLFPA
jgi:hypothetical protein